MKYSIPCPNFRIAPCTIRIVSGEIEGTKKRSKGSMIKDVFCAENVPVDIQNIKLIQRSTGNQYSNFRMRLIFC